MADESCIHCGQPAEDDDRETGSGRVHERCWDAFSEEKPVAKSSVVAGILGLGMVAGGATVLSIGLAVLGMASSLHSAGSTQNPLVGIPAAIMWFMAMGVAYSAISAGAIMLSIAFFTWVVTKIFGVGPKDSELPAHDQELAQDTSTPWVVWYRRYLYFVLVISVIGQLLFGAWQTRPGMISVKVVLVIFVLMSLRRFGEKWITILHLAVNGATLMAALFLLMSVFGFYGFFQFGIIQSLLLPVSLLGADFGVLLGLADRVLGNYFGFVSIFGALALGLISVYWLKNLYKLMRTSR